MSTFLNPGRLRERVEIQTATETQDAAGQPQHSWATVATVWAEVRPLTAGERWRAQQMQSQVTHRVTLRYDSGSAILTTQRILYRSRVLHISGARNLDERRALWELDCIEQV